MFSPKIVYYSIYVFKVSLKIIRKHHTKIIHVKDVTKNSEEAIEFALLSSLEILFT